MLFDGLHIPLTTPFHPDGRLHLHKLASNVARYSKTPAAGLILLGQSAEPTLLSDAETREVLRTGAQSAAAEKVLVAGICRDSVHATLPLADFAAEQNYDAILIGIPSFLSSETDPRELLTWFQTIADRSPLPTILFSTDSRKLPLDATIELAAHPNIIGLLTAESAPGSIASVVAHTAAIRREVTVTPTFAAVTARMKKAAQSGPAPNLLSASSLAVNQTLADPPPIVGALRTRTKSVGFQIVAAHTPTVLASLRDGATAIAPALSACAPQACYEIFAAWKDGDQPLAEEKQARLISAARLAEATPGTLKSACDLNGYFGGLPRLPHLPPTGDHRSALEDQTKALRN